MTRLSIGSGATTYRVICHNPGCGLPAPRYGSRGTAGNDAREGNVTR